MLRINEYKHFTYYRPSFPEKAACRGKNISINIGEAFGYIHNDNFLPFVYTSNKMFMKWDQNIFLVF